VHAARALEHRLGDNTRDGAFVLGDHPLGLGQPGIDHRVVVSGRVLAEPAAGEPRGRRPGQEDLPGHKAGEQGVHPVNRVAHAHCPGGVAVVRAAQCREPPPARTPGRRLILDGELQRDLDGH